MNECLIKSKRRVQKSWRSFYAEKDSRNDVEYTGNQNSFEDLTPNLLEPAAGEGAFLVAILERK